MENQNLFNALSEICNFSATCDEMMSIIDAVEKDGNLQGISIKEHKNFLSLVRKMRSAQNKFFKSRHPSNLETSRDFEKTVDYILEIEEKAQFELF
jgi:hypothetical protein